jgi:hypothetical protein
MTRPGCTAADNTIIAKGHLDGLAQGLGGYGVLRPSKEKPEEAAAATSQLGRQDLAQKMREVSAELPQVRTREQAAALAPEV